MLYVIRFQVLALPYGDSERVQMLVFLPAKNATLEDVLIELDNDMFQSLVADVNVQKTNLLKRNGKVKF